MALASTSFLCLSGAQAQTMAQAGVPEQVMITGRLEENLPGQLALYGTQISTVTTAQIQNGGYLDIAQALPALVPGLYIAPKNGPFDYVDLSLQGGRTQDVLWLVDGVRINNRLYGGTTPLDTLPASIVERIEVLEGSQALFYGTQAIAGAIQIVTKDFSERPDGSFTIGADTQSGRHLDGYFRDSIGAHHFVVYGASDRSDGYQPFRDQDYQPSATDRKRDYDVMTIGGKYAYDFDDSLRLSISEQHTDAKLDFANPFVTRTRFNERNEDILSAKIDYAPNDRLQVFLKGYYHWWYTYFTRYDNDVDTTTGDVLGSVSTISEHEFWGFTDYGVNALAKYSTGAGVDLYGGYDFQNYSGKDVVLVITQKTEHVHAFFGQVATTPDLFRDVKLSAGLRYNSPSVGESATVWNVSGRWDVSESLFLRGMVGTSFRLPTAEELFADDPNDERGNPDLKPETATNVNASMGGRLDVLGLNWEATYFHRDVKDLIDLDTFDSTTNQDVFGNLSGKVKVQGAQFVVNSAITNEFSVQASYSFNTAENSSGLQINRVPEQVGQAVLDYHPMNMPFGFSAGLNYVGTVHDTLGGGIGRQEYGNYVVVDLSARAFFDMERHHRVDIGVHNLFDEQYATRLIRALSDVGSTSYLAEGLGVPQTFYLRYTYNFF